MKLCGILMPVFSLPSPYGIGTLGKAAYEFVDFLQAAGQQVWQVLPLHPTGYGNSPYYTTSCFAGNPWLIDLDLLAQADLLTKKELSSWPQPLDESIVDHDLLMKRRTALLYRAFCRSGGSHTVQGAQWLEPYCAFMARKDAKASLPWSGKEIEHRMEFHRFLQSVFYEQWFALKDHAGRKGVQIIGDLPFYVPCDSADVFFRPELFYVKDGRPSLMAGCPPDQFNSRGQLWGSPVYRWDVMERDGYRWWLDRIAWGKRCFDGLRLDHFRGFESFWAVPAQAKSAAEGRWMTGPGKPFLDAVKARFPDTWFLAEDLGDITPQVRRLLDGCGFWGMRVIQFGFENDWTNEHLPHRYTEKMAGYTSLHDTMTAKQWLYQAPQAVRQYFGKQRLSVWDLIADVLASPAGLAVIAMQDYLELGEAARMNCPGTVGRQNWSWRVERGALHPALADRIRRLCRSCGRGPA